MTTECIICAQKVQMDSALPPEPCDLRVYMKNMNASLCSPDWRPIGDLQIFCKDTQMIYVIWVANSNKTQQKPVVRESELDKWNSIHPRKNLNKWRVQPKIHSFYHWNHSSCSSARCLCHTQAFIVFQMTNRATVSMGRSVATSSCARLGDISGNEGSWKMTPALVWRQWPVSINAERGSYLLIPPDLAFTGHQPQREAENNDHHCALNRGERRLWILLRWVWRTSE